MTLPSDLRVAMFHTRYTQPGGEDRSTSQEIDLLRSHGVEVEAFYASNAEMLERGAVATAAALWRSAFNRRSYEEVRSFCRRFRPHVAHVQNFWFALSPSVHAACHAEGVATVQTLRNYRLLCVNGLLLRDGGPCETCIGRSPWPGIRYRCYHDSVLRSALVARMIHHNRTRGTWDRDVDRFVALTEGARARFVAGGLPAKKILVKPNFVRDPGEPAPPGRGGLFLGRLAPEKGIDLLLDAWTRVPGVDLEILGDGPDGELVRARAARDPRIRYRGRQPAEKVWEALKGCGFLVMASRWYEGFPRVLLEALAAGRPVVAPRLGSMAEILDDERTGLLFTPNDPEDLARQARRLAEAPGLGRELGRAARREYEDKYAPERNFEMLTGVYDQALSSFDDGASDGNRRNPSFCSATSPTNQGL